MAAKRTSQRTALGWQAFWNRILSTATARFLLALLSLACAQLAFYMVMKTEFDDKKAQVVTFALGQLFALPFMAWGFYFGSNSRKDDPPMQAEIVNTPEHPVLSKEVSDESEGQFPEGYRP